MSKRSITVALVVFVMAFSGWRLAANQAPAAAPAVKRTVLNQQDLPVPGMAMALVRVELPVGAREGRHHHPGTLMAIVEEGTITLDYEGKPTMQYKVGDTFYVEPGKVHEGMNKGTVPVRLTGTFVFPKAQPMTIQEK